MSIEKDDWRLSGQDEYLKGKKFLKIKFPEFWKLSKNTENDFYKKLWNGTKRDMEALGKDAQTLKPEEVPLWWHDHCEFCWEKIEADKDMTCYCTEDYYYWVCEECYNDFKDMLEAEDNE